MSPTPVTPPTVTALGSLPGTDFPAALRLMLSDLPELAPFPELPARGVGSDMIGRALALTQGLGVDLQPAGWRLTDHDGTDIRRARDQWRRDLDDWEEHAQGFSGTMKLGVAGPWTLAAAAERPRGDRVLADHGARRDLAESLAAGLVELFTELRRRMPTITWWLQLDEPSLPAVQHGQVATASGRGRHRSVDRETLAAGLSSVRTPVAEMVDGTTLHCCAPGLDLEVVHRAAIDTVALDLAMLATADLDALAGWLDAGRQVWWGVLPSQNLDVVERPDTLADRWTTCVQRLGFSPRDLAHRDTLTPSCGLAGWSAGGVSRALAALHEASQLLAERRA